MVPIRDKVDLKRAFSEEGVGGSHVFNGAVICIERQDESLEFTIFLRNFYESLIHKKIQTYTIKKFPDKEVN